MSIRAATAVAALGIAVVVLCALPALLGDFVYDDELVRAHPLFDGWENLWRAFVRTSHDYSPDILNAATGATYRPVPVASLVLTNILFSRAPLPHHWLSLGLHLLTCTLIARLGVDPQRKRASACWLLVTTLFALHPLVGETFQWISGRNDLLAGCALAGAAVLLQARLLGRGWAARDSVFLPVCGALLLCGALCKEPFLVAATFLLLAELVAKPGRVRVLWPAAASLVLAFVVTNSLRALASPHARSVGAVLLDTVFLLRIPHALGLALETLLLPAARPMRSWSWELEQPWSTLQASLLVLALAVTLWLVRRQQLRSATLLVGAAATLAPTAAVAEYFWLGLDRYVHLPCILLLVALAPFAPSLQARLDTLTTSTRHWLSLGAACCVVWFAFCSWATATSFAGQAQFSHALISARPADPSGYLVGASSVDDAGKSNVLAYLSGLTQRDLPPAFVHAVVLAQSRFGLYQEAVQTLERAVRSYPYSSHLRFDLLELRGAQHRFNEGLELSDGLLRDARLCPVARAKLMEWDGESTLPATVRERLRAQLDAHPCG